MARNYNVEGTKTFLITAIALLVVGLWHLKDGWFPSEAVLVKHPLPPEPGDSFYAYNKIVAVAMLVGSAVCGYVHKIVK